MTRPEKVKQQLWKSFLSDLLRPTGLLVQHVDDFDFLHQTHLEYHASRHATRDEQARTQLLHDLFPVQNPPGSGHWKPPDWDPSYLGFLLDGLLAPPDHIASETIRRLESLTSHEGERACTFLTTQVRLGTNLPPAPTARQLARFAEDSTLDDPYRVRAIVALAQVDQNTSMAALTRLAQDSTLRAEVALALGWVDRDARVAAPTRLAQDPTLRVPTQLAVLEALGWEDRDASLVALTRLAQDPTLPHGSVRMQVLEALCQVDEEAGVAALTHIVQNPVGDYNRVRAAEALTRVDRAAGVTAITRLVHDDNLDDAYPRPDNDYRLQVAEALARVDRDAGVIRFDPPRPVRPLP